MCACMCVCVILQDVWRQPYFNSMLPLRWFLTATECMPMFEHVLQCCCNVYVYVHACLMYMHSRDFFSLRKDRPACHFVAMCMCMCVYVSCTCIREIPFRPVKTSMPFGCQVHVCIYMAGYSCLHVYTHTLCMHVCPLQWCCLTRFDIHVYMYIHIDYACMHVLSSGVASRNSREQGMLFVAPLYA
jgi:hypothetical protein